ncbi:YdcF family protein [Xylocopilactobacillus apis]|uniref:Membrane protein n=1 Tax=Xylocopilactobacillus apis TaxID=2932183 RepID=A0AAU9DNX8_9LACO|nr:YdcF family protein [Xylocopilactobacillus apis]BDR56678.1 membrane protein [Xylocopilactobacillus apis]
MKSYVGLIGSGLLIVAFFLIVLLIWQLKKEPRTLKLGILCFTSFICFFLSFQLFIGMLRSSYIFLGIEAIIITGLFMIFPFILAWYLLYQLIKLWIHEAHTFSNFLLTIAVSSYIFLLILVGFVNKDLPTWGRKLLFVVPLSTTYLTITFVNFFLSSFIYGIYLNFKQIKSSWVVVLGSGLINGRKVGKLLGNRIEAAVRLASKMKKPPKIIFSGGQGSDELISEAEAMRNYAVKKYKLEESMSLIEPNSRNTKENLIFSSKLTQNAFIFCTSDYHVFRAALLAKELNIKANGIGSRTSLYYRGTAFLREYLGVMVMHKKRHLTAAGIIIILSLLRAIGG